MLLLMLCNQLAMTVTFWGSSLKRNRRPRQSCSVECPRQTLRCVSGGASMRLMLSNALRSWRKLSKWSVFLHSQLPLTIQNVTHNNLIPFKTDQQEEACPASSGSWGANRGCEFQVRLSGENQNETPGWSGRPHDWCGEGQWFGFQPWQETEKLW